MADGPADVPNGLIDLLDPVDHLIKAAKHCNEAEQLEIHPDMRIEAARLHLQYAQVQALLAIAGELSYIGEQLHNK